MNIVEFQDVTFATNKHYNSLQNINFQLKKGEKALLFASNDSGVIEFFRVMLRFENAFTGKIQYKISGSESSKTGSDNTKPKTVTNMAIFLEKFF